MPVDLICIPERAENRASPSVRRWLVLLLALVAGNGLVTAWLWPAGVSTHTPLFWVSFPGVAVFIWTVFAIARLAIFLTPVFGNDGWNHAREEDIAQEVLRGQRSLSVLAQAVQLPHVIASGSLSGQLLIADGISLPSAIDSATNKIIHQARFDDVSRPWLERLISRLQALLSDGQIQSALRRLPEGSVTVALETGRESMITPDQRQVLERGISGVSGLSFPFIFIEEGPGILDSWLDEPDLMQTLLVLAVNLSDEDTDGVGEAAVALLLQSADCQSVNAMASVHRPEQTNPLLGSGYALQQALLWGMTTPDDICQIWLTGTGDENKADSLFSEAGIRFPVSGAPCDIDLRIGQTGCASPWLAIAVAGDNLSNAPSPQLIMGVAKASLVPWFMVISPPVDPA